MGWTSYNMNQPIKEWFKEQWDYENSDYEVIDSALVKRHTLYGAVKQKSTGKVFCAVFLIRWSPKSWYNFSYKDMTEFAGPCEDECPEKIFKLLTPLNDDNDPNGWAREWRKRVEKVHVRRKKLKEAKGKVIKTKDPVEFSNGATYQYFKKVGRRYYTMYLDHESGKFHEGRWVRFNPAHYEYELIEP